MFLNRCSPPHPFVATPWPASGLCPPGHHLGASGPNQPAPNFGARRAPMLGCGAFGPTTLCFSFLKKWVGGGGFQPPPPHTPHPRRGWVGLRPTFFKVGRGLRPLQPPVVGLRPQNYVRKRGGFAPSRALFVLSAVGRRGVWGGSAPPALGGWRGEGTSPLPREVKHRPAPQACALLPYERTKVRGPPGLSLSFAMLRFLF